MIMDYDLFENYISLKKIERNSSDKSKIEVLYKKKGEGKRFHILSLKSMFDFCPN